MTLQREYSLAHGPLMHGSTHFEFLQAFDRSQSELLRHSGRQLGGELIIPASQLQIG
jgi:hypothetical protein